MNETEIHTDTPNGRFHRLASIFASTSGRLSEQMRPLTTKMIAVAAIVVVAGTTLLAPAAQAWSDEDDAVAIVLRGGSWGNVKDVDVDADGSIYACGHFRGDTDLDPHPTLEARENPGGNNQPGVVVKLDSDGNHVWHATVDTPNGSILSCVAAADGSVYATGFFRQSVEIPGTDPLYAVTSTINANHLDNAFVAKFSADGSGEWLRTVNANSTAASSDGYSIDVDSEGSAYVTGVLRKNGVDLDLDLDAEPAEVAAGLDDQVEDHSANQHGRTFFVKLNANGTTEWSHSWGGTAATQGLAVVVDNVGEIVVGGWTNPVELDLDPADDGDATTTDDELIVLAGGIDNHKKRQAWMSKFDRHGDLIWGHTFGSAWEARIRGLAVDAADNVYATGTTGVAGKTTAGGNWQTNPSLPAIQVTGIQHRDIFTAKFDSTGTTEWVEVYGGHNRGDLVGEGIAVAGDIVYTAGSYRGTVDFSRGTAIPLELARFNSGTKNDPFLVRHNAADGSFACVVTIADTTNQDSRSNNVAVDSAGNAYLAGYFHGTSDFDPAGDVAAGDLVGNQTLFTSEGASEGFVARYTPDCALDAGAPATPPSFTVTGSPIVVSETGTSGSFTVVLDTAPAGTVVFDVTHTDSTEAVASATTLTFTTDNWDTPQSVTVTGVNDDVVDGTTASLVAVSVNDAASDDAWDALANQMVNVTTTDDDVAGVTDLFDTYLAIDEGVSESTDVFLLSQPTDTVTYAVTFSGDVGAVASPTTLTFTTTNWNVAQTLTVTGVTDDVDDVDQFSTLHLTPTTTDSNYASEVKEADVDVLNVDTAGITLTGTSVTVSEAGTDGSVNLKLDSKPTADVTFTVTGSDTGEASVAPTTITFTTANWNIDQTVTVTGVDDVATDGPQASTVTLSPASTDSMYDAMDDLVVDVTTTDDDTAGVTVSQSDGSSVVSEAGSTDVVSVVLNTEPTSNVTITVALSGSDEASTDVAELTFTTSNWNVAQDVTVTGADDDVDDGDQDTTMTFSVSGAAAYAALADQSVTISTLDDETSGFTVLTPGTTVSESGTTQTLQVVLDSQPTGTVVISATGSDPSEASVSPTVLTFTTSNWNVAQDVTVVGLDDTVDDGDITSTVTLSIVDAASATEFAPVADVELPIVTTDDDDAPIEVEDDVEDDVEDEVVDPGPTVDPDTVVIVGNALCSAAQVTWTPDVTGDVSSFILASKAPGGAMTPIDFFTSEAGQTTIGGLTDGTHSFQILMVMADDSSVESGEITVNVSSCDPTPEVEVEDDSTPGAESTPEVDTTPEVEVEDDSTPGAESTPEAEPTPEVDATPEVDETPEVEVEVEVEEDSAPEVEVEEDSAPEVDETPEEDGTDGSVVVPPGPTPTPGGGDSPGGGTNPEATNTAPGTSGTGTGLDTVPEGNPPGGSTRSALEGDTGGDTGDTTPEADGKSDFSEGNRIPVSTNTLVVAAGIAAAAGLGLTGFGARIAAGLLRFLAGSSVGLFLIGLFRRDRRPGQPENFVIFSAGSITNLVWTAPRTGKAPDRYIAEGLVKGAWREVFGFDAHACRAGVPTSEIEGIYNWRLRAANAHGIGKPSEGAILAHAADEAVELPLAA